MHVLYVHKNYPAQFGHLARHLIEHHGFRCTYVSERAPPPPGPIRYLQYKVKGGATARTHYCSRTIENFTWHSIAVYETMKAHPEIKPDLVVGHSGFGSTLFLGELYDCPIVNYCEWYYHSEGSDSDFRAETTKNPLNALRSRVRNAALLADLQYATAAYSPTHWQRTRLPAQYQYKLQTIFDGMDTDFWRRQPAPRDGVRRVGNREIPPGTRIVTYVSRGFESVRGFDVFMKVAETLCRMRRDVIFICIGSDKASYGDDSSQTQGKTFREHVLSQGNFDLDRFIFTGQIPPPELARILSLGDLHVYLTVPFVLSWSMLNAMSCGCVVLASDTEPVREVIDHGRNGLLAPFYDVEGFAARAAQVLDDPGAYRFLGEAAIQTIHSRYSMQVTVPKMLDLYRGALSAPPQPPAMAPQEGRLASAGQGPAPRPAGPRALAEVPLPSITVSVADPGMPDPFHQLAQQHPWPKEKPTLAGCEDCRWMRPAQEKMLCGVLDGTSRLVIEVGAWTGLSTRALARCAPQARLIAIDRWCGVSDPLASADWKAMLPEVYQRFLVNCWAARDRIVPLRAAIADGLGTVHALGLCPQLVYLSLDHSEPVERILDLAHQLFPTAVLAGSHWGWPRLRSAIRTMAGKGPLELEVADGLWRLWRKP